MTFNIKDFLSFTSFKLISELSGRQATIVFTTQNNLKVASLSLAPKETE